MKLNHLIASIAALLIIGVAIFATQKNEDLRARYDRRDMTNMEHTKGIKKALEYLTSMKGERLSGHIDQRDVLQARYQLKHNRSGKKALNLQWDEVGPDNVGGRTRALCIDPSDPNTIYIGGVAGGLWKTTTGGTSWIQITDVDENLSISSIEMGPNGEIYVGTGETFANVLANSYSTPGVIGTGIYKSTDGATFNLIPSTIPSATNSFSTAWALVNRLAVADNGDVWAATNNGLKFSNDGGSSWIDPPMLPNGQPLKAPTYDVKLSPGGIVGAVVGTSVYISKTGSSNDFTNVSTGAANKLPNSNLRRVELGFAHNDSTIYAVVADGNGALEGVYMSDDKGDNWSVVGPGGSTNFEVFGSNNQGGYDNVIAVDPDNPHHVFVGGVDMWEGTQVSPGQPFAWTKITQNYLDQVSSAQSDHYVHADHHIYKFHPTNSSVMYAGTDGGIFRTQDKGNTFTPLNRNYNVTQFYTLAIAPDGGVMGGTQDNSTPYVSGNGNTPMNADVLFFGDGGHAAFSALNQDVFFASSYYGLTGRSIDKGADWEFGAVSDAAGDEVPGYYSQRMINSNIDASFVTPLLLWESVNVVNAMDSIWFKADSSMNYTAGDTILCRSKINRYPFKHILSQNINGGDSIQVADRVQSRYYLGTDDAVWMTMEALDFSVTPQWFKIAEIGSTVQSMVVSEDGDVMYVGTQGGYNGPGQIYRISNIMAAWDSTAADVTSAQQAIQVDMIKQFSSGRWVTSIAMDPSDKDHIIVTLGNYGESTYIYRSTNATSASPTFSSRQGDLPAMPVYASLIPMFHGNSVIIGTEYGIYATDNISSPSPTWVEENNGFDRVPVFMLRQQTMNLPYYNIVEVIDGQSFSTVYPGITNYGRIYAATHGRGFFSTDKYSGIQEPGETIAEKVKKLEVKLYPNPVENMANIEFELNNATKATFRIFDINGRLMSVQEEMLSAGQQKVNLDVNKLDRGTYILQMIYNDGQLANKRFVKM